MLTPWSTKAARPRGRTYLDDRPQKPIRIWSRTGRHPLFAAGNSNLDISMLEFTQHEDKPYLRLLVLHDDADSEFDYTSGADQALQQADTDDGTVVSIKNDWAPCSRAESLRSS